jgi:hypothetical protein
MRKSTPKELIRRGQWKAEDTVSGLDWIWWREFHQRTE